MKKILITLVLVLILTASAQALTTPSILPTTTDTHYYGAHDFLFDLGSEGTLSGRLEFAVYSGTQAQSMMDWTGHSGSPDTFVYAYQVFCDESSTAAMKYFLLTGINPTTIASVEEDISQQGTLNSASILSDGVKPKDDGGYFNDSKTKAIWEFEGGTMVQGEQSWFLFLYSQYDWIIGDIEVQPMDDDIPIPGVPEPTTMALLIGGMILSLKRRK